MVQWLETLQRHHRYITGLEQSQPISVGSEVSHPTNAFRVLDGLEEYQSIGVGTVVCHHAETFHVLNFPKHVIRLLSVQWLATLQRLHVLYHPRRSRSSILVPQPVTYLC